MVIHFQFKVKETIIEQALMRKALQESTEQKHSWALFYEVGNFIEIADQMFIRKTFTA